LSDFCPPGSGSGYGSTVLIETGSETLQERLSSLKRSEQCLHFYRYFEKMAGMEVLMRLQARATAAEKLVTLLRQQIRESKVSRPPNSYICMFLIFISTVAVQKISHMQTRNPVSSC
jgi:hypothetical protein